MYSWANDEKVAWTESIGIAKMDCIRSLMSNFLFCIFLLLCLLVHYSGFHTFPSSIITKRTDRMPVIWCPIISFKDLFSCHSHNICTAFLMTTSSLISVSTFLPRFEGTHIYGNVKSLFLAQEHGIVQWHILRELLWENLHICEYFYCYKKRILDIFRCMHSSWYVH